MTRQVRAGNERVVRPRLADAAFFHGQDRKRAPRSRRAMLKSVTFQAKLGSLHDKCERVRRSRCDRNESGRTRAGRRAADSRKCDLLT